MTIEIDQATTRGRGYESGSAPVRALVAVPVVTAVAGLLGAATSWGQLVLPEALTSLANSAGGWALVAFGLVWWARSRPLPAAALGLLAFSLLHAGYAVASASRGLVWSLDPGNFWVGAGLVAGPLVGLGASWARRRRDELAGVGVAGLSGLLVGEGVYGLTVVADTTSPVYWTFSVLAGLVFLGWATLRRLQRPTPVVAVLGTALVAVGQLATYAVLNGSP